MFDWKESKCVGKFFLWYWIFPVITWTTTEKEKTATTKLIQHQIKCCLLLLHFSKVQIIISSSSIILHFFKCKCIAHTQERSWWFGYYCCFFFESLILMMFFFIVHQIHKCMYRNINLSPICGFWRSYSPRRPYAWNEAYIRISLACSPNSLDWFFVLVASKGKRNRNNI